MRNAPPARPSTLPPARPRRAAYDAIVVGARVAGAATAMLLARRGLSVLLVDRAAAPGTDTLSTHALMRAGVLQLRRWGLLDRLEATGAPPVSRTVLHYGDEVESVDIREKAGVGSLFAPRRTVLDPLLVAAAAEAGVEVRFGIAVERLLWRGDRVIGVAAASRLGERFEARARLVIGADGVRSLVARSVPAPATWCGTGAGAMIYGYWPADGQEGYEWFYRPRASAGVIPTNGGEVCCWVGAPRERFLGELGGDPRRAFERLLPEAAPEVAARFPADRRLGSLRGFAGVPGFLRRPWGAGWALVGDAGAFRDPLSAHGMTDALRDAELLADAAATALGGGGAARRALAGYERARDEVALPIARLTDAVASYRWTLPELRDLLLALSKAMGREVEMLAARDTAACDATVCDAAVRDAA
jgi:2-polyprenyl-6-methoxyphenol hydroxylase-like FAD-dependent oxidoreductase